MRLIHQEFENPLFLPEQHLGFLIVEDPKKYYAISREFLSQVDDDEGRFVLSEKYKANICCFQHNYQEVINIMTYYKNHIGTYQESTLEYFDLKEYTESQVDMAISNLENSFKDLGIKIVDAPEFTKA